MGQRIYNISREPKADAMKEPEKDGLRHVVLREDKGRGRGGESGMRKMRKESKEF